MTVGAAKQPPAEFRLAAERFWLEEPIWAQKVLR